MLCTAQMGVGERAGGRAEASRQIYIQSSICTLGNNGFGTDPSLFVFLGISDTSKGIERYICLNS